MFSSKNGFLITGEAEGPAGQQAYTSAGTYSWVCPVGVTSVCVVCVGGGGGGIYYNVSSPSFTYPMQGGAGGGLGWKNNIPVVAGQSYTVVVGNGGSNGAYSTGSTAGGVSYFKDLGTVAGFGGNPGRFNSTITGGYFTGDGGGNGGNVSFIVSAGSGGGGGAGGYTGNGGIGGRNNVSDYPTNGSGGGGAGGGSNYPYQSFAGGGVGIYGQGSNGLANPSLNGGGGSGGTTNLYDGGLYGAGGGGSPSTFRGLGGSGGSGAVRIIWGNGRAFPATNTADV